MTRRQSSEPLTKCTLNLFSRDVERMQAMYPGVGYSVAVRQLVRAHVMKVDAQLAARMDESLLEELEVDVEI